MKIYDITAPISSNMPIYKGDPTFTYKPYYSIESGDGVNVTFVSFGTHSGTHIDAPLHHFKNGKSTSQIPLDRFIGKARVLNFCDTKSITAKELMKFNIKENENILFKTDNANAMLNADFKEDFVYIEPDAAEYLAKCKINMVGIDYLSVEKFASKDSVVHQTFLQNEIIILEGLYLYEVEAKEYNMTVLPLNFSCDGVPVRAILTDIN